MSEHPGGTRPDESRRDEGAGTPLVGDGPDALTDPAVDEVARQEAGAPEETAHGLQESLDAGPTAADDPGADLNY